MPEETENIAAALSDLFLGSDLAFGRSVYTGVKTAAGKLETRCWTEKKAIILADWINHVLGKTGVGIIPINSLNCVTWGAIDVDNYAIDPVEINRVIQEKHFPLVPCLSKSGGVHLYLFCKTWIPAEKMVAKLDALAALLGFGSCEIFPKQNSIRVDPGREDYGNWLNMPYFGKSNRKGMDQTGLIIEDPFAFVTFANSRRLTAEEFDNLDPKKITDGILKDGPPCLNILWEAGKHEGFRNVLLANTCVYLKRAFPEGWEAKLEEFNRKLDTPLPSHEIATLKKSYGTKDYKYQCQDCHLKQYCNSSECKLRKFGIAESGLLVGNRSLTKVKTDPPIWFLDIRMDAGGTRRVSLATEDLQNPARFQLRCMADLNLMPPLVKPGEWRNIVSSLLEHVAEIDVPPEATPEGRFQELLEEFLLNRKEDEELDCLKRGGVFFDENFYYFRLSDLLTFLLQKKFGDWNRGRVTTALQAMGGSGNRKHVGGENLRFWQLPKGTEDSSEPITISKSPDQIF